MNDPDKISVKKDGRSKKATYYNHIHMLFSLYQLSEIEIAIMRNLSLAGLKQTSMSRFHLKAR